MPQGWALLSASQGPPQVGISLPRGLRGKTGPSPGAREGESQVSLQRPHPLHSTRALTQKHLWGLPDTESKAEDSTRMPVGTGQGWGGNRIGGVTRSGTGGAMATATRKGTWFTHPVRELGSSGP